MYNEEQYEFDLEDRIAKIRAIDEQYDLEHNSYIAFSGGKDSCVLSKLIDIALPGNNIPRVFSNTGIEYSLMVKFVKNLSLKDKRIIILSQDKNIKKTLENYGYPFKSKEHSMRVEQYQKGKNSNYIKKYVSGWDLVHGKLTLHKCPNILKYQFTENFKLNISPNCCSKLKKALQYRWQKANKKTLCITGMRQEEGGNRKKLSCLTGNNTKFHPLSVVSEDFEHFLIERESGVMQIILSTLQF